VRAIFAGLSLCALEATANVQYTSLTALVIVRGHALPMEGEDAGVDTQKEFPMAYASVEN